MKMGNCLVFGKTYSKLGVEKTRKKSKENVQIVKIDGKIIELETSTTVGSFLVKFTGFSLAISLKPSQFLQPDYELEKGSTYYLVPVTKIEEKQCVKRIKVVVTKQQLHKLLAEQISFEDVLVELKVDSFCPVDEDYSRATYFKEKLESIPEEMD